VPSRHGSLRDGPLLGAGADEAWPAGAADASEGREGLRQAQQERRRFASLRNRVAPLSAARTPEDLSTNLIVQPWDAIGWMAATLDGQVEVPWSFSEEAAAEKYMPQLQHNMWVVAQATLCLPP
jgi:hypothetical protein